MRERIENDWVSPPLPPSKQVQQERNGTKNKTYLRGIIKNEKVVRKGEIPTKGSKLHPSTTTVCTSAHQHMTESKENEPRQRSDHASTGAGVYSAAALDSAALASAALDSAAATT